MWNNDQVGPIIVAGWVHPSSVAALPKIARQEGKLGQLLADGSVAAAKKIGKGLEYTVHSKGLEAPMHDPRGGGH
ncbi:MAG: hypothetical protein C0390_11965, partial [Syntrophus sp. (in: bacteria)]|nr:hypothetical protein [Syntrophus sp. (in: bacteria)]